MTSITIVRHGTTTWMEEGRLHGRLDSPLSARGRDEAQLTGERLKGEGFEALYSSPLGRAQETAAIIARAVGLQPVAADELREVDFGWLDGRRVQMPTSSGPTSVWHKLMGLPVALALSLSMALSGERWGRADKRVARFLQRLLGAHPTGRVLLVAHSGTHHAILRVALGVPTAFRAHHLAPCGITQIGLDATGEARVIALNDTAHLV